MNGRARGVAICLLGLVISGCSSQQQQAISTSTLQSVAIPTSSRSIRAPTTPTPILPSRPANATSIYDVNAEFPCNNFIFKGQVGAFFARDNYDANRMASMRVIVQNQCPQYLAGFDAAATQIAVNASTQSVAAASASEPECTA